MDHDDRPLYIRLRESIANSILDGSYRDGDALPSVRVLAVEYGANPLTVAKAYQSFQDERLIVVKRGVGMFVSADAAERLRKMERDQFLHHTWPRISERIKRLRIEPEELFDFKPS